MRRVVGAGVAVVLAAVAGLGVWTAVRAVGLLDGTGSTQAAALQALAAAATLLATVVLVAVTAYYALLTERLLRQSGPDVSARLRVGFVNPAGGLVSSEPPMRSAPPEGFTIPVVVIEVRNRGNAAVTVSAVKVETDNKFSYQDLQPPAGPSCPFRLDGHTSETFVLGAPGVYAALDATSAVGPAAKRARGLVELASGQEVRTQWMDVPSS